MKDLILIKLDLNSFLNVRMKGVHALPGRIVWRKKNEPKNKKKSLVLVIIVYMPV